MKITLIFHYLPSMNLGAMLGGYFYLVVSLTKKNQQGTVKTEIIGHGARTSRIAPFD